MKKIISTATKVAALALAASSFSFAGPGLSDGAAKFVGNITTRGQVRTDVSGPLSKAPAVCITGMVAMPPTIGLSRMEAILNSMLCYGVLSTRGG